jgi:hypothetical protein
MPWWVLCHLHLPSKISTGNQQLLTVGLWLNPSPADVLLPCACSAAGQVLIDDRPVGEYERKWLKQRVALVSQEPVLYARSIRRWGGAALGMLRRQLGMLECDCGAWVVLRV